MIITISGMPGSGKSTVGKVLAKRLGYKFYSMGDLRGKMAMDRGLTIDELNELGRQEDWTDREVDEYQTKLAKKEDNFVIDGRVSFYFIPNSFKIFLIADLSEAARRVFKNQRPDEGKVDTVQELEQRMRNRIKQDDFRYKKYYGIDFQDQHNFDLVLDTTGSNIDETVDKIMKGMVGWKSKTIHISHIM